MRNCKIEESIWFRESTVALHASEDLMQLQQRREPSGSHKRKSIYILRKGATSSRERGCSRAHRIRESRGDTKFINQEKSIMEEVYRRRKNPCWKVGGIYSEGQSSPSCIQGIEDYDGEGNEDEGEALCKSGKGVKETKVDLDNEFNTRHEYFFIKMIVFGLLNEKFFSVRRFMAFNVQWI